MQCYLLKKIKGMSEYTRVGKNGLKPLPVTLSAYGMSSRALGKRSNCTAREGHVVSLGDWSSGKIPEDWIPGHISLYKPTRETHRDLRLVSRVSKAVKTVGGGKRNGD